MLSTKLRLIYERAVYEAELEEGRVRFQVAQAPVGRAPSQALAIVTAWNPAELRPERAVNERANVRLAEEIERCGWRAYAARGGSGDGSHVEPSFAVANISRAEALALGRRYAQAAVFYWDGSDATILYCSD
ncbi:MAG: DUF3293 domain-containing protein [Gammaproteobacteria bacterium]|nr:DUF3293 domain-containing protein [Gammaproteobacteria bacterium]